MAGTLKLSQSGTHLHSAVDCWNITKSLVLSRKEKGRKNRTAASAGNLEILLIAEKESVSAVNGSASGRFYHPGPESVAGTEIALRQRAHHRQARMRAAEAVLGLQVPTIRALTRFRRRGLANWKCHVLHMT